MLRLFLFAFFAFTFASPYERDGDSILPNHQLTPGAVDSTLTTAQLCDPSFHTGSVRNVTEKMKRTACAEYGQILGCPGKDYEIDHLISIEIGGSNDPKNLWPQPVDAHGVIGYHTKDIVENRIHAAVCKGTLTLEQAQIGISGDWYAFGKQKGFIQ